MKQVLILISVIGLLSLSTRGQDPLPKPELLPGSPEAAAFAKNVNIPMDYSSGTPQINIPFHTVKSGGIEIPISISYNASGIRVEEVPTWVGLGWNLNAGGQISRTVRGLPDETYGWGYMNVPANRKVKYVFPYFDWCYNAEDPDQDSIEYWSGFEVEWGQLDLEPDEYQFSFMGYSGKFIYNQDSAKFILIPYQNVKLTHSSGSFVLTLPNGIRGHFGAWSSAVEKLQSGTSASYINGVSHAAESISPTGHITTWMVTDVIEPTGKAVKFEYDLEYILTFGRGSERFGSTVTIRDLPESGTMPYMQSFFRQYISKPVLTKIVSETSNVYFKKSSAIRLDMPNYSGGSKYLDTILITTANEIPIKSFHFDYDYFTSPSMLTSGILHIDNYAEEARKRLYLKSIVEKSNNDSLPGYHFTYSDVELPSRLSTSQDYWGYYNGKSNLTYLMPKLPAFSFNPFSPTYDEDNQILPPYGEYLNQMSSGADRRIDTNFTEARILKRVQYPTGGSTQYIYEQNKASTEYLNVYGGMLPPDMVEKSFTFDLTSNPLPSSAPYPLYFKGVFAIDIPATKVKFSPSLTTCQSYEGGPDCIQRFILRKRSDSSVIYQTYDVKVSNVQIQLTRGEYLVEVISNGSSDDYPPSFQILAEWGERHDSLSFPVGGVRIKKVISSDSLGRSISKSFTYVDSLNRSSGIIDGCPSHIILERSCEHPDGARQNYSTNSILPISTEGRTVRYDLVSEYLDSNFTSMKVNYHFTSGVYMPYKFGKGRMGVPPQTRLWQNNLLKKKEVFEKIQDGTFRIIAEEENFFYPHQPLEDLYGMYGAQQLPYYIDTEWYLPDSSTTKVYSYQAGQQLVYSTGIKYLYNSRYLQSETRSLNSKGDLISNKTWYPTDYNNVYAFNISSLASAHIISLPIKHEKNINGKIRSGSVLKYTVLGRPIEGYSYESQQLLTQPTHDPDNPLNSNYVLKTTLSYDVDGNLKQVNSYNSPTSTYIWDYSINNYTTGKMEERPMAVVHNADSSSVAYTSFENISKGNWEFTSDGWEDVSAILGNKVWHLSVGSVSKSGLNSASTYIVSYWGASQQTVSNTASSLSGKTVNGLTYYEHKVVNPTSGVVTVSGSGTIDELRLYPEKAQMITYDYNEFGQLRAMCDVSSKIVRYEYDNFHRLSLVRDIDSNILKKYCYNYAGQVENCGLGTEAQWQIVSNTCEVDSLNRNTGNLIRVKKDTNPNSSTYDQSTTSIVANLDQCPLPYICTTTNCTGDNKKCINNVCETGVKEYTGSIRLNQSTWRCYYIYRFSDNSTSSTYYEDRNVFTDPPCPI